jgi:hypothetical protein
LSLIGHVVSSPWLWILALLILFYPSYLLVMGWVLRLCGVPRDEIASWALRQAGRQRFLDLLRATRGASDPTSSASRRPDRP